MSSYFNVRICNMSLFVNKWCNVHLLPELGFEPGRMLGSMLGFIFILRCIYVSYRTYSFVDSMLGFQCKYNIGFFTVKN